VWEWSWDRFICSGATPTTPNDAPQQTSPNYKTKKQGPLPLLPPERQAERERGGQRSRRWRWNLAAAAGREE
jgi:hypothetical protein